MNTPLEYRLLLIVVLILAIAPRPAAAQWTPGGVSLGGGYDLTPGSAVSDGAGGVIVCWDDLRDGPYPNRQDVYAQRWSSTGVELWDAGGAPVCTHDATAANSRVVSDGAGGAIIVWTDSRSTGSGAGIYAQHLDASGVAQWADQGVFATAGGAFIGNMDAVADGLGGVVIVWVDSRTGGQLVYAQRLDATGTPQWAGDVLVPETAESHYTPRVVETLDGGAIIAWVAGPSINRDVLAQRLNAAGGRVWNAGAATAVCDAPQSQSNLNLIGDGAGGVVITWEDRRLGDDIYAQRLNSSGAAQWTSNGVAVCNFGYEQASPRACPDGTGGAIIMWSDQRDQGGGGGSPPPGTKRFTEPDLYMQRVNGFGELVWTSAGRPITTAANYQYLGGIVSDGAGGAVISWVDDSDDDSNGDVMMQRYDASGVAMWAAGGVMQSSGPGNRQVFAHVGGGADNTIPLWTTYDPGAKAAGTTIFVQRVDSVDGECTCGGESDAGPLAITGRMMLTPFAPNPSSGSGALRVYLARSSELLVDVYNVRGQRVASQRVGESPEGWRTLSFDGHELPNGVYFYSVSAGGERQTTKIVIQR